MRLTVPIVNELADAIRTVFAARIEQLSSGWSAESQADAGALRALQPAVENWIARGLAIADGRDTATLPEKWIAGGQVLVQGAIDQGADGGIGARLLLLIEDCAKSAYEIPGEIVEGVKAAADYTRNWVVVVGLVVVGVILAWKR